VEFCRYNWTNVDILWDAIRAANSRPIVELSFMPSLLANCSWDADRDAAWIPGSHNITRPGAPKCSESMFYGGVTMPPAVWDDWYHLWNTNADWNPDLTENSPSFEIVICIIKCRSRYHLVRALVEHAVSRYGVEEVREHWAFEVWK
jgi:beta-xylosidase